MVICFNSTPFLINIIKICKPLSKLDLPTVHQGSMEERTHIYLCVCLSSTDIKFKIELTCVHLFFIIKNIQLSSQIISLQIMSVVLKTSVWDNAT